MTHPSDLVELRERVRKATGPDRDLDKALSERFGRKNDHGVIIAAGYLGIADFTASIDAALRLVGEALPSHEWEVHRYWCELWREDFSAGSVTGHGQSAPLAILDAALTALSQLTGE